jgi:hypothetical protein
MSSTSLSNVLLGAVGSSETDLSNVMLGDVPQQPGYLIQKDAGYSDASDSVDNSVWDALNEWTTTGIAAAQNDRDDVCWGVQSFPSRELGKGYLVVEVYCISGDAGEIGVQDAETPHWHYNPDLSGSQSHSGAITGGQTRTLYGSPLNTTTRDFVSLGYFSIETLDASERNRSLRLNKVSWQDATGLEELWNKDTSSQLDNGTVTSCARLG